MKVLVISFMEAKINRKRLVREVLDSARGEHIDLVVTPGNVQIEYTICRDQQWASKIADEFGLGILYEALPTNKMNGNYYSLYSASSIGKTGIQKFTTSSQVNKDKEKYNLLISEMNSGNRTIEIEGVKFGIIICGENNVLENKQSDSNKVGWRYSAPKNWQADVIINPSHNTMGNWDKLNKRYKFLSKKYGYVVYLTNSSGHGFGKSSLRIFKNGKEIKNGEYPDFITNDKNAIGCVLEIL